MTIKVSSKFDAGNVEVSATLPVLPLTGVQLHEFASAIIGGNRKGPSGCAVENQARSLLQRG